MEARQILLSPWGGNGRLPPMVFASLPFINIFCEAVEAILTAFYFAGDVAPAQSGKAETRQQGNPQMQCVTKGKVNNMICGSTPTHIFCLPFESALVKEALIVYFQGGMEIVRKETDDCTMEGRHIGVQLSQEETLAFDHRRNVQIQLRVVTTEDVAYTFPVYVTNARKCLTNEVII